MELSVKLFGERNTATRAVKKMLRNTPGIDLYQGVIDDRLSNLEWANIMTNVNLYIGEPWQRMYREALRDNTVHMDLPLHMWKHSAPSWSMDYLEKNVATIICVRNPYSWLLSMAKKPYHMKAPRTGDFMTFLRRPWLTERRDNTLKIVLPSVVDLWNEKMRAYADFVDQAQEAGAKTAYVLFEKFIARPQKTIGGVLHGFGCHASVPEGSQSSTKPRGAGIVELQRYYGNEEWKNRLTREAVEYINQSLDWPLVDQFCYKHLNPDDFPDVLPPDVQAAFTSDMMNMDRNPEISFAADGL